MSRTPIRRLAGQSLIVAVLAAGCASPAVAPPDYDAMSLAMIKSSFEAKGQATLGRLDQDPLQRACSAASPPSSDVASKLEAVQLAAIQQPPDGRYLGDWKAGEKLAQDGRGMTWSDRADAPAGGNCYNCHQLSQSEISYGTLGPSLYNYGKLRGVSDPSSEAARPIVRYTWGKIYDAKASNACSLMPRFGQAHVLTTKQMQDIMALLLDPKSPVNQ
ncbi:MAG: sulfur oxidation c-type cytochrome SoxX [Caldimonas sp.]